jgi:hypothetical protein
MSYSRAFAGVVISSGATLASPEELSPLVGIPVRNYYGMADGLTASSLDTQARYEEAVRRVNGTSTLETIAIEGADHLQMTDRPWDVDVLVDGYPGVLSWLLDQRRAEPGRVPL